MTSKVPEKEVRYPDSEFKLDNTADLYAGVKTSRWSQMFGCSVTLSEEVDKAVLEQAVAHLLQRMPFIAHRLKAGFTWYRFAPMDKPFCVVDNFNDLMKPLNWKETQGFLFRIRCHHCQIIMEFFHALTDAGGSMTILLTLLREYLRLKYAIDIPTDQKILDCDTVPQPGEYENAFIRYARKESFKRLENEAAYYMGGPALPQNSFVITAGRVPTGLLHDLARQHHATVSELLCSMLLLSFAHVQRAERNIRKRRQPVKAQFTVDLRRYFPTPTLRNFSSYALIGTAPGTEDCSLDDVIARVHNTLKTEIDEERLLSVFSGDVSFKHSFLVSNTPLMLKKPIMKFLFRRALRRHFSTIISNLGVIDLPEEMSSYIERIEYLFGPTPLPATNMVITSYNNQTSLIFTRTTPNTDVERHFFDSLVKAGIPVQIESIGSRD